MWDSVCKNIRTTNCIKNVDINYTNKYILLCSDVYRMQFIIESDRLLEGERGVNKVLKIKGNI